MLIPTSVAADLIAVCWQVAKQLPAGASSVADDKDATDVPSLAALIKRIVAQGANPACFALASQRVVILCRAVEISSGEVAAAAKSPAALRNFSSSLSLDGGSEPADGKPGSAGSSAAGQRSLLPLAAYLQSALQNQLAFADVTLLVDGASRVVPFFAVVVRFISAAFVVLGEKIRAHKLILGRSPCKRCARSLTPHLADRGTATIRCADFAAMFGERFNESKTGVAELKDVDAKVSNCDRCWMRLLRAASVGCAPPTHANWRSVLLFCCCFLVW